MKERISFSGKLRGDGHEAECTVSATRVTLPGTSAVALAEYSIQKVSKTLPEGRYQLFAHGEVINLRHHSGQWLSDS
jgi:hypothetical protein